jgi:hypothetical protein
MALTLTPGAYTREIDKSFVGPQIAQDNIYGIIGFSAKGKAFVPTPFDQYSDFQTEHGGMNTNYFMPYAVKEVTKNGTTMLVTRVLGTDSTLVLNKYTPLLFSTTSSSGADISSISGKILGILRWRTDSLSGTPAIGMTGTASAFTITISGVTLTGSASGYSSLASATVTGLSIDSASPNYIGKKLGTNPMTPVVGDLLTSVYVERVFDWYASATTAENTYFRETAYNGALTATTTITVAAANVVTSSTDLTFGDFKEAQTPWIVSQNYDGVVFNLVKFHTFSDGTSSNYDVKISISNVVAKSATKPASFDVSVRLYDDSDGRPIVVEQFKKCTLVATDKNFINRLIGDTFETFDPSTGDISKTGNYPAKSQYVYVEISTNLPVDAMPSGFKSIEYLWPAAGKDSVQTPYMISQLSNGDYSSSKFMGVDFDTYGAQLKNTVFAPLPSNANAKEQLMGFLIMTTSETASSAALTATFVTSLLSTTGNQRDRQFSVPFYDGWDGIKPTETIAAQATSLSGAVISAVNLLNDRDLFDFDVMAIPDNTLKGVQVAGSTMCAERGDAYFIMDADDLVGKLAVTGSSYFGSVDTSYAGANYPWIKYFDPENDVDVWVPASIGTLEAMSFNDKVAFPWWAAAGENRGVINSASDVRYPLRASDLVVYATELVNPIRWFKGRAVRFGQKTLQRASSYLQDENIRRLLIKARKVILAVAQTLVFEPNDPTTWTKFEDQVNPILEDMQLKRGIKLFKVIMDETTNTQDRQDRNEMYAKIAIQPTKTGEVFLIDFFILNGTVTINDI